MDFFQHQEDARQATRRLIGLFVLAVIAIAGGVSLVTAFGFAAMGLPRPQHLFLTNTLLTALFVGGGSAIEISRLRAGGEVVAREVGGRPVTADSADPLERRYLNVVEEMALAAGVPVPRAYVLDRETGINAFAAGWSVNDAVVAVTRGALARLSRQELQGVVAHEFSHILNGDMRLNLRLMGVLYGLLMLSMFGRFLMEAGRGVRQRDSGVAVAGLIGVAVWLLGWIGVFFGRWIKAAVSRRREFLADASAVQFTRDPEGLGGALRKIGGLGAAEGGGQPGSELQHRGAESVSHLLLGPGSRALAGGFLATHPPLEERVRRLYGRTMPWLPAPELAAEPARSAAPLPPLDFDQAAPLPAALSPVAGLAAAQATPALDAAVGQVASRVADGQVESSLSAAQRELLARLHHEAESPDGARRLVLALLLEKGASCQPAQRELIAQTLGGPAAEAVAALHELIALLPPGSRLPLADLATPVLRGLPPPERERLLMLAHGLIQADGQVSLPEFLLFTVLERRLGRDAQAPVPVRYRDAAALPAECGLLLSLVAALRAPDAAGMAYAAGAARLAAAPPANVPFDSIRLDALRAALIRLNQLAPLAKPALIKALTATAFWDEASTWRAASALRTIAIALDCPLPPRLGQIDS